MDIAYSPSGQTLQALPPPLSPENLDVRRRIALQSIQDQREAVRQNLLQTRLAILAELEPRWRGEIRSDYETDLLLAERDQTWFEAFQAYGRARFPLLVSLILYPPDSETYQKAQASLQQLERDWQATQRQLESAYQTQLTRIEQEVEVRVRARQRAFVAEVEREVEEIMAAQPRAEDLYLPPIERLNPAPAQKSTLPAVSVRLVPLSQSPEPAQRRQANADLARAVLRQLAEQWAQSKGYQLTDDPTARDATQEFARYLQSR